MQRLPTKVKKLRRTHQQCRDRGGMDAGERLTRAPVAPDTLSDAGKKEWRPLARNLVEMGVLTRADLRTLELCCETLATATALEETIHAEGFTIEAATGGKKAHPALKALETTRNAAHRMLSDFGLSPKSRKYVERAPAPAKDNPWSEFSKA